MAATAPRHAPRPRKQARIATESLKASNPAQAERAHPQGWGQGRLRGSHARPHLTLTQGEGRVWAWASLTSQPTKRLPTRKVTSSREPPAPARAGAGQRRRDTRGTVGDQQGQEGFPSPTQRPVGPKRWRPADIHRWRTTSVLPGHRPSLRHPPPATDRLAHRRAMARESGTLVDHAAGLAVWTHSQQHKASATLGCRV